MGVEGPVVMEGIVEEDMVVTVEVEDQAGMVDIMVATEGIMGAVQDIVGIMAGRADIMAEAISTEVPASTSADTMGSLTTIHTGIILTPITILTLPHFLIKRR